MDPQQAGPTGLFQEGSCLMGFSVLCRVVQGHSGLEAWLTRQPNVVTSTITYVRMRIQVGTCKHRPRSHTWHKNNAPAPSVGSNVRV